MQRLRLSNYYFWRLSSFFLHLIQFDNPASIFRVDNSATEQESRDGSLLNFIDGRWWSNSRVPRSRQKFNCAIFIFIDLIYRFCCRVLELELGGGLLYWLFFVYNQLNKAVTNLIRYLVVWTYEVRLFMLMLHCFNLVLALYIKGLTLNCN